MKGVILSRTPQAQLVDISHAIAPQNVLSAAYVLLGAHNQFPAGTIHLVVVDPGVGSNRREIILQTDRYVFVGPDNGLFSLAAPQPVNIFEIQPSTYLPESISDTFHGRDVFAPVAAALAAGVSPAELGSPIVNPEQLPSLAQVSESAIRSRIIHIDRFGNGITGIERRQVLGQRFPSRFTLRVGENLVRAHRRFYAEEPIVPDAPFTIWGSLNFLEISIANGSATELLRLEYGQTVTLELG